MMRKQITEQVKGMTVAQMRKAATQYGIKNASKFKRVDLEKMIVEAMLAEAKANAKKGKAAFEATNANKRYKATKVVEDEIEVQANAIIEDSITGGLFDVNRKVLIAVMKKLGCEKWYRTYDKPTMVDKIVTTMIAV